MVVRVFFSPLIAQEVAAAQANVAGHKALQAAPARMARVVFTNGYESGLEQRGLQGVNVPPLRRMVRRVMHEWLDPSCGLLDQFILCSRDAVLGVHDKLFHAEI